MDRETVKELFEVLTIVMWLLATAFVLLQLSDLEIAIPTLLGGLFVVVAVILSQEKPQ